MIDFGINTLPWIASKLAAWRVSHYHELKVDLNSHASIFSSHVYIFPCERNDSHIHVTLPYNTSHVVVLSMIVVGYAITILYDEDLRTQEAADSMFRSLLDFMDLNEFDPHVREHVCKYWDQSIQRILKSKLSLVKDASPEQEAYIANLRANGGMGEA